MTALLKETLVDVEIFEITEDEYIARCICRSCGQQFVRSINIAEETVSLDVCNVCSVDTFLFGDN